MESQKFYDYITASVKCAPDTWVPHSNLTALTFTARKHLAFDENIRFSGKNFNPHLYVHRGKTEVFDAAEAVFRKAANDAYDRLKDKIEVPFEKFFKWGGKRDGNNHLYGAVVNLSVPLSNTEFDELTPNEKDVIVDVYQVLVDAELEIGIKSIDFTQKRHVQPRTHGGRSAQRGVGNPRVVFPSEDLEKILRGFTKLGSVWIETLVGRKNVKDRQQVRLRKVAGIDFTLTLKAKSVVLTCGGDVSCFAGQEASVREKIQKKGWDLKPSKADRLSFSIERQGILLEQGVINEGVLKQLHSDYEEILQLLIREGVFSERKDPLARQFVTPEGCKRAIEALKSSLVFAMSNGSHELFHTNVWAWLVRHDPAFAKVFFPDIKGTVVKVSREQGNRDLTIWVEDGGQKRAYVVENKFKSYPRRDQLEGYQKELGDQFVAGLLVMLNRPAGNFDSGEWLVKTQTEVCAAIRQCMENSNLSSASVAGGDVAEGIPLNRGIVLDYISMTEKMTLILNSYSDALGEEWALALDRDRGDGDCEGDLESVKLQDIFKKFNAAKMVAYLEATQAVNEFRAFLAQHNKDLRFEISHDFLHKLPVLNCEVVKRYAPANPEKKIAVGVMLQGASFARSACSFDKKKYRGAQQIYSALADNAGWFDDQDFLVPGLRIFSEKKSYKQYVTNEYTVAYQDIGLPCYSFAAISDKIKEQFFLLQKLLGDGKLDAFFNPPELAEDEDDANAGTGAGLL